IFIVPLLQLILFGYALSFDVNNLSTAICDLDKTSKSREFKESFLASKYFTLTNETDDPKDLEKLLDQGSAKITIFIPKGFGEKLKENKKGPVQILIDGSDPTIGRVAYGYSQGIVEVFSLNATIEYFTKTGRAKNCNEPVKITRRIYFNPELKSVNFIVPGLIAIFLVIIPTVLTSIAIVREKELKTIDQLTVTPLHPFDIVIGKTTPYLLLALVNAFLVTVVGTFWFNVPLKGSPLLLALACGFYVLSTVSIGLLISTMVESQQVAMMIAMLSTYLPSILLSGFIFPIKSMPKILQIISYAVPTKYFIFILRGIFLKGIGITYFPIDFGLLVFFAFLIGFLTFLRVRSTER
ncbi:MAG: ABC transporter permease, partial [Actinomycetia bacterium]|nr:ABC transporter permease [Actinomycetes bacterium]